MQVMNSLTFEGKARWDELFESRGSTSHRGLLSFSNHVSLFDDPLLISALGHYSFIDARWIGADHINFFSSAIKGVIFSAGKCVPMIRGAGLNQPGFDFLKQRLLAGDWVHLFPEGGRSREAQGMLKRPFKRGIGRLIHEARPILMPFYHYGMHEVLPIGSVVPRVKKKIKVLFGHSSEVNDQWWSEVIGRDQRNHSEQGAEQRVEQKLEHELTQELVQKSPLMNADQNLRPEDLWTIATDWAYHQLYHLERQLHPVTIDIDRS